MRILKLATIAMSMFVFLCGCDSDDDYEFKGSDLYQTQWKGNLKFIEDDTFQNCTILISFETSDRGRYISEDLNEDSKYSKQTTIEYSVEDRIITLYGGVNNILLGDWWIVESTDKSLRLKREPNTKYESTLNITKIKQ